MSIAALTILFVVALLIGLFTGLPVAFVLIGLSIVFLFVFSSPTIAYSTVLVSYKSLTTDIYIAAPLFTFMAYVLEFSGIASALYDTMHKWFGGVHGGLAMGTVVICTLLAAMTGLGATGVVTMGVIALPEMLKRGYNKQMAVGAIPFGGALGPLIPPSVLMIIVGGYASLSIGKLFIGGVIPGLMMSLMAIIYIGITCRRNPAAGPALPPEDRVSMAEKMRSLRSVIAPVILVIAVIGSIYAGAATASEAGAVGAFGALICAAIYKQLSWDAVRKAGLGTVRVLAMVMWLIIGGSFFSTLLGATGSGKVVSDILASAPGGSMGALIIMMFIALILGCFMDGAAITIITIPVFMPVIYTLGLDPLWFGLLFTINMIIGYLTPPFGMNLFYMKGLVPKGISMGDIYRSVAPYVIIMVTVLILSIAFPQILLWLPSKM